jgi:hypothetical protein
MTDTQHHVKLIKWDGLSLIFSLGVASECNPPDLCLPSSRYYRQEPLHLA